MNPILKWSIVVVILGLVVYAYRGEPIEVKTIVKVPTPQPHYIEKEWHPTPAPIIKFGDNGRNWKY